MQTLQQRLQRVEEHLAESLGAQHEAAVSIERMSGALKEELLELRAEAEKVDNALQTLVRQTHHSITLFKNVARQQELKALSARVDMWDGESYILRREFLRWLREEFRRAPHPVPSTPS